MSASLSNQAQLRYVLQWFQEWSEMQRGDFLNILIEKCGPAAAGPSGIGVIEGGGGGMVNGLLSSLDNLVCKDDVNKPPSLFECRVKLFREWCNNWSEQEKDTLLSSIKNLDSKFAEKYEKRIIVNNDRDELVENDDNKDDDDDDKDKDDKKKDDDNLEREENKQANDNLDLDLDKQQQQQQDLLLENDDQLIKDRKEN